MNILNTGKAQLIYCIYTKNSYVNKIAHLLFL